MTVDPCYLIYYTFGNESSQVKLFCSKDELFPKVTDYLSNRINVNINESLSLEKIPRIDDIIEVKCFGCKYDRAGQLEHMGMNGCLERDGK